MTSRIDQLTSVSRDGNKAATTASNMAARWTIFGEVLALAELLAAKVASGNRTRHQDLVRKTPQRLILSGEPKNMVGFHELRVAKLLAGCKL